MPIVCTVDRERHLLLGVAKGSLSRHDVLAHLEERHRIEASLLVGPLPLILDAREASQAALTPADLHEIVDCLKQLAAQHDLAPTAVLVGTDVSYGVLRQLEVLAEDVCSVRPFRDRNEAERWLSSATEHSMASVPAAPSPRASSANSRSSNAGEPRS